MFVLREDLEKSSAEYHMPDKSLDQILSFLSGKIMPSELCNNCLGFLSGRFLALLGVDRL